MKKPKAKHVFKAEPVSKKPFMVTEQDFPVYPSWTNTANNKIPYQEAMDTFIYPLIKQATQEKNSEFTFERDYWVSNHRHGPIYCGLKRLLLFMADIKPSYMENSLSFGLHYKVINKSGRDILHATMLYNDGPYAEIQFYVQYYDMYVLKYDYFNHEHYTLDYDALEATYDIFNLLERCGNRYKAFNGFFDVQSYMSIPRFLRPNGAIQLPSFPGIDYQAKRKVHKIMNQIGWLTVCYEEKIKSIERA